MHNAHRFACGFRASVAILTLSFFCSGALAQTGPDLLAKPWPDKDQYFDGRGAALFDNAGHIKESNQSFRLDTYESAGRFHLIPGSEISPRVGYDFSFMDLHTNDPKLPNQLTDVSVGVGMGLFKNGNWIGAMSVGLGYAGDSAFANGAAWYGKADLMLVDQLNENDFIGFGLDYDGHRPTWPDIPIPGVAYSHRFDPHLQIVAGFPFSSLSWKPIDPLDIELEYELVSDLRSDISYQFVKHWKAYGLWDYRRDAYHVSELPSNRRLMFVQYRVEAGIRFQPKEQISAGIGLGYAFDTHFRSGWDFQDTKRVADASDVPYVRAEVSVRF